MQLRTIIGGLCLQSALLLWPGGSPAAPVDFHRQIRPILSEKCFACHGPDEAKREADLRLDTREGLLEEREGERPVVAGAPEQSEVWRRIIADDPDQRMPPADSGKTLTPAEIEVIGQWIRNGAKWSGHWAFDAPRRPAIPQVKQAEWVRNPIDAFVLARLESEQLKPAAPASPQALVRRLFLDLLGIPPNIAAANRFAATHGSPASLERFVDELLQSPHYGERWGQHWLDAARYADSDGYEKDKSRQVWFYRDWVIGALNRDLPYDQFIIDQLAGDLRPQPTQDQIVATGFLRNSMINEEGGIDPEQFRMEAMYDRMDAIGKGVLGLTIQCAQCHNHKYDPLSQEDYYRLFAYLNDCHEANAIVYTSAEQMQRAEILRKTQQIEDDLRHQHPHWREQMTAWEEKVRHDQPVWHVVPIVSLGDADQRYLTHGDHSLTAWGYAPTQFSPEFRGDIDLPKITAVRLEMLCDPNLPLGGPGRSPIGLFGLTDIQVEAVDRADPNNKVKMKFISATADFANEERVLEAMFDDRSGKRRVTGPISFAIDGNDDTAWGIDAGSGRRNVERKGVFVAEQPVEFPRGATLTFTLKQNHGGWNSDDNQNNNLGRFRLSVTDAPAPTADPVPARVRTILAIEPARRTPAQVDTLFSYWRTTIPDWQESNNAIEALWRQHPVGGSQLVLASRESPRMTQILARGDFLKPVKPVSAGVPSFLHPLTVSDQPARLTFAQWMVDRRSPTTARAIVNRVWQTYFGTGIVGTAEDFGSQGELPSHPELLDWLAVEFMEHGWSLKWLHRLIVSSATYQQTSHVSPENYARDPQNRLLARGPRLRVEGEIVRDIGLAASGLWDARIGGRSLYPPAPEFLFQPPASYGPKVWNEERGGDRYRRAMYTFRYRSVPYPALQTFDAPNGDAACVRRSRSNTPLQALTTLNEPLFLECSRALARRILHDGGSDDVQRLVFAFGCCVARVPTPAEQNILIGFLREQTAHFSQPNIDPQPWIGGSPEQPAPIPSGVTPAQMAGWTSVARVLLNMDETITKE